MNKFYTVSLLIFSCIYQLKAQSLPAPSSQITYLGPSSVDLLFNDSKPRLIRFCKAGTNDWATISSSGLQAEIKDLRPKTTYIYQISDDGFGNSWSPSYAFHTIGRPNILMIIVDDGRYDNWEPNKAPSWFVTP